MTSGLPEWVPPDVDITRANAARVYDYWLGGNHNFLVDQDAARALMAVVPQMPAIARACRAYIRRSVSYLAGTGIDQFLDIGSGIPTEGNVHEIAQRVRPGARVLYTDIDPVAIAHSKAILAGDDSAAVISGDLRSPKQIVNDETVRSLIDFSRPVALILMAVLHFIPDSDEPWRIVAELRDTLAPGSCLVLGHGTTHWVPAKAEAGERVYNRSVNTDVHLRTGAEISRFFDGFQLIDPGLVSLPLWRPDRADEVPADPTSFGFLGGVGVKP